jgi:hypothetical protein
MMLVKKQEDAIKANLSLINGSIHLMRKRISSELEQLQQLRP